MKLLVVRHGVAVEPVEFAGPGRSDAMRPLTDEGRADMARAAAGLRALVDEIDVMIASPLLRARQTAEIVAAAYGVSEIGTSGALRPESRVQEFRDVLRDQPPRATVAIFGHEPHLSTLVTWLVTGADDSRVRMGKGSACLLELSAHAPDASAVLRWLMSRKQLMLIGAASH